MATRLPYRLTQPSNVRRISTTARAYTTVQAVDKTKPVEYKDQLWQRLEPPSYPYGEPRHYKQSNRGLYGGLRVQVGNNVSDKTKTKTRRTWYPNIVRKRLFSVALNQHIPLKVAARVIRTIDKVGGLDEYLLGDKPARIKELGVFGWRLRWIIMNTPSVRMRMGQQAKAMGVEDNVRFERGWMTRDEIYQYLKEQFQIKVARQRAELAELAGKAEVQLNGLAGLSEVTESEVAELAKMADGLAVDGLAAAEAVSNINDGSVDSKKAYKVFRDIEQQTKPVIIKVHDLNGRRGRRVQKYDMTVLSNKSLVDHEHHMLHAAYLETATKPLVERALPGRLDGTQNLKDKHRYIGEGRPRSLDRQEMNASIDELEPSVMEQPAPVSGPSGQDTRTVGQKLKDFFSRVSKEHTIFKK